MFIQGKYPQVSFGCNDKREFIPLKSLSLILGGVGSGKSLFMETILLDLANMYSPRELKFLLLDPRGYQYTTFDTLPHLLAPSYKESKGSDKILNWVFQEVIRRYELLEQESICTLEEYNERFPMSHLPNLIFISYEFSELMINNPSLVEKQIVKIGELGGNVGIHLILASHRFSDNLFTKIIKTTSNLLVSFSMADTFCYNKFFNFEVEPQEYPIKAGEMLIELRGQAPIKKQSCNLKRVEIDLNLKVLSKKYTQEFDTTLFNS